MIYLVRHGQTEFNREGRYQGRVDSPLTELGLAQARAAGARLAALAAEEGGNWIIETSPLGRARRTAEIIAQSMGLPALTVDPRLIEVSYGEIEGLTAAEIEARWPKVAALGSAFGLAPGGETMDELLERVGDWLREAEATNGRRRIAVTHAGFGRALRGLYSGLTPDEMRHLDRPQDAIFRLGEGRIDRIECPPLPSAALGE
jgi:probable phosphoglycerate mutase